MRGGRKGAKLLILMLLMPVTITDKTEKVKPLKKPHMLVWKMMYRTT